MDLGKAIDSYTESVNQSAPAMNIDIAKIGLPCERWIWYEFNHVMQVERRAEDIAREEQRQFFVERFTRSVIDMGLSVYSKDPSTRQRWHLECQDNGYLTGSMDGVLVAHEEGFGISVDTPHVFHVLALSDKEWNLFKNGGTQHWDWQRFVEVQLQMALTATVGRFVGTAVVVAYNVENGRSTSDSFTYDAKLYESMIRKADLLVRNESIPKKCTEADKSFMCRLCPYKDVCSGETLPEPACRNCGLCTRTKKGEDVCEKGFKMDKPCNFHLVNPDLIIALSGDPIKYHSEIEAMEYEKFFNGNRKSKNAKKDGKPTYTSAELFLIFSKNEMPDDMSDFTTEMVERFNATVTDFEDALPDPKDPHGDSIPF